MKKIIIVRNKFESDFLDCLLISFIIFIPIIVLFIFRSIIKINIVLEIFVIISSIFLFAEYFSTRKKVEYEEEVYIK